MRHSSIGLLSALILASLTAVSGVGAQTVMFGASSLDHLGSAGTQTEAGFDYTATGAGWEIESVYGNPNSALVTFFNGEGSTLGDKVDFTRNGGGLFNFDSVDFRTLLNSNSDQVILTGFLAGSPVGSLALNTSSISFQTVASGIAGPLDLLRVEVTFVSNSNALILDNLVFRAGEASAVPEPAAVSLLGAGSVCLLALRRRRNK